MDTDCGCLHTGGVGHPQGSHQLGWDPRNGRGSKGLVGDWWEIGGRLVGDWGKHPLPNSTDSALQVQGGPDLQGSGDYLSDTRCNVEYVMEYKYLCITIDMQLKFVKYISLLSKNVTDFAFRVESEK